MARITHRWANVAAAAAYAHVAPRTIRQHVAHGNLRGYKPRGSRVLLVDLNDIDQWIIGLGPLPVRPGYGKARAAAS
jgi:hypothetical protein